MTNLPRKPYFTMPGAPVFQAEQIRAAGRDPAEVIKTLRRTRKKVLVGSPNGVRIDVSLEGDRVRVAQLVLSPSVKVLHVNGRYKIFLQPTHNEFLDTVEAALPGHPVSRLFKATGFDRDDVRIGTVQILKSEALDFASTI